MRDVPSILRRAAVPEMDFSGHVVLAGPKANPALPSGTRVFGSVSPGSSVLSGVGTLAEFVEVPSNLVQAIPPNTRLDEAATFGGLAQTGLKMVETAGADKGHWTLIHGASGAVGIVATQLAKAKGATVVATCSASKFDMVTAAGADKVSLKDFRMAVFWCCSTLTLEQVIDYTAHGQLHKYLQSTFKDQPFDSIMDAVGSQDLYVHSPAYLKPKGIYVNVGSMEDESAFRSILRWAKNSNIPNVLGGTPRKFAMFGASVTQDGVKKLAEHAKRGYLKVFIDSTFKLEDVLAVSCFLPWGRIDPGFLNIANSSYRDTIDWRAGR